MLVLGTSAMEVSVGRMAESESLRSHVVSGWEILRTRLRVGGGGAPPFPLTKQTKTLEVAAKKKNAQDRDGSGGSLARVTPGRCIKKVA